MRGIVSMTCWASTRSRYIDRHAVIHRDRTLGPSRLVRGTGEAVAGAALPSGQSVGGARRPPHTASLHPGGWSVGIAHRRPQRAPGKGVVTNPPLPEGGWNAPEGSLIMPMTIPSWSRSLDLGGKAELQGGLNPNRFRHQWTRGGSYPPGVRILRRNRTGVNRGIRLQSVQRLPRVRREHPPSKKVAAADWEGSVMQGAP